MAGFFDSLSNSLGERLGERPGETPEETAHRRFPVASYVDDTVGNIPQGLINAGQGVYEAVTHPQQTAESLYGYATHPVDTANKIYEHYKGRYGSIPQAVETLRQDPVGVAGDVMPVLGARNIFSKGARRGAAATEAGAAETEAGTAAEISPAVSDMENYSSVNPPTVIDRSITPSEKGTMAKYYGGKGTGQYGPYVPGRRTGIFNVDDFGGLDQANAVEDALNLANRTGQNAANKLSIEDIPTLSVVKNPIRPDPSAYIPNAPINAPLSKLEIMRMTHAPGYETEASVNTGLRDLHNPMAGQYDMPPYGSVPEGQSSLWPSRAKSYNIYDPENLNPAIHNSRDPFDMATSRLTPSQQRQLVAHLSANPERAPYLDPNMLRSMGDKNNFGNRLYPRYLFDKAHSTGQLGGIRPIAERPPKTEPFPGSGSVVAEESPGSLNFGVTREGYQEPKRSYVLPKALDISGTANAVGSIPLALALATNRNKQQDEPAAKPETGNRGPKYLLEPIDIPAAKPAVVANIPKDEPAAEPKAAPKAATKTRPSATPHRAATKRAAPRSASKAAPQSNEKYWGDWRDTDPFASDPIGNFIDSITGQQKRAAKPGRANVNRPSDLGSLFSDGGMVRKHYEEGGAEDRIPIVSDIGDALGSLFQGGEQPVVAKDRAEEAPADKSQGFGGLGDYFERWSTNPLSQLLFASGAATMGSPSTNPWQATGEGLSRGLEYMQAAQANQERLRDKEEARKQLLAERRALDAFTNAPETVTSRPIRTSENEEVEAPQQRVAQTTPVTPNIAPPSEETPAPKPAPVEPAPKTVAETETAPRVVSPVKPVTQPIVATDDRISSIDDHIAFQNSQLQRLARLSIQTPHYSSTVNANVGIVKNRIAQLERQRQDILNRQQKEEDRAIRQKTEERIARQNSPEGRAEIESQKLVAKKIAEEETGAFEAADQAKNLIDQFEPIKKALEDGTLITGAYGADRHNTHKTILAATGRDSDLRSRLGDYMNSAALKQAFAQLGGRLGSGISNSDREAIMGMGVSLDNDKNYNIDSIIAFQNAQKRNLEYTKWVQEYKEDHGGKLGVSFLKDAQEWKEKQP
jgi:hypothetical protein